MNNNNWGSQQPHGQAFNDLPQMPPQAGWNQQQQQQQHQQQQQLQHQHQHQHQQYGNGNDMAYMGNQQFQTNAHFLPPPTHQMQPMPQYAQPQAQLQHQHQQPPQMHPANNYHAQLQQQQQYTHATYNHAATQPAHPSQYMSHVNYSTHPKHIYPQHHQQVAAASPRQMQQSIPSPRPAAHPQVQPQRQQSISIPIAPQPRPPSRQQVPNVPSPQPQHQSMPFQPQHHAPSPQVQRHIPSPQLQTQQHAPSPRTQTYVPSPRAQQHAQSPQLQQQQQQQQQHAPSPRIQTHVPPQPHHHVQSPQPRKRDIEPNATSRPQKAQQLAAPSSDQRQIPTSIDPSKLQQDNSFAVSTQPIEQASGSMAINPSSIQLSNSNVAFSLAQAHVPVAIDPSQLQNSQALAPSPQIQEETYQVIDPSQLMLKTDSPIKKSVLSTSSAARSPNVSTRSPTATHAYAPGQHFDTPAVLICVANDCFRVAHSAMQDLATSLDQTALDEYYKLVATGLGCLDAALMLNKLPPRTEANIRLRYATILSEETVDLSQAEVTLTKGITVCEKNRLADLKYCMQFQLLKVLFRRNRKAALVALDKNISEATTYKAVDWVYAFRFLRASFHLQSGNLVDAHALENLRSIFSLAHHRGDHAIAVVASLLEGIGHLKSRKEDSIVRVQTCIAQAARYQLEPSVQIPQIEVLTLLLDLACSLQQKVPKIAMQKLKALQIRMDELVVAHEWDQNRDVLLLPLRRQPNSSHSVTGDTKTIIQPGPGNSNYIVMSFVTKVHAFVLAYVLSGLALLYQGSKTEKVMEYWNEALNMLAKSSEIVRPAAHSLPMAIEQAEWRAEIGCYIYTLIALTSATRTQWTKVHDCLQKIEALSPQPRAKRLNLLVLYVKGVYYQGTGDLDTAFQIFNDRRLDVPDPNDSNYSNSGIAPPEVALLATLNRIWILQEPSRRDDLQTMELVDRVRPYCSDHPDTELRTAFNLVAAAIETNPPQSIQTVKRHISSGLKWAQAANNTQLLGIALNLMRSCLFDSVVGDQAVKSAKAGKAQAQKAGNLLWMSVGEGMLAQTEEMQGQVGEAERLRQSGTVHANEAFAKP